MDNLVNLFMIGALVGALLNTAFMFTYFGSDLELAHIAKTKIPGLVHKEAAWYYNGEAVK